MTDGPVVLSSVLCFLKSKFGKHLVKTLKISLTDFCTAEDLSVAKNQLIKDIDSMKLPSNRPHVSQRRDGDGRLQREVDDLIFLFT